MSSSSALVLLCPPPSALKLRDFDEQPKGGRGGQPLGVQGLDQTEEPVALVRGPWESHRALGLQETGLRRGFLTLINSHFIALFFVQ